MTDAAARPRIGILSLSVIPDDPRVRRQGDILQDSGWEVVGVGLSGGRSPMPAWRCLSIEEPDPTGLATSHDRTRFTGLRASLYRALAARNGGSLPPWFSVFRESVLLAIKHPTTAWRMAGRGAAALRRICGVLYAGLKLRAARRMDGDLGYADRVYHQMNGRLEKLYERARCERVDLWLANDWTSLPVVNRLAREQGVAFGYDTHELAIDEYAQHTYWRLTKKPIIAAIERNSIRDAAFVSCVSHGIAQRMFGEHGMRAPPIVIRNVPRYQRLSFRPTGPNIRVLYHGIVSVGRGLESCIQSVAQWRPEFDLTIRGPASAEYLAHLKDVAANNGVSGRVIFDPPVPMVDLVRRAAEYDVGLFALPDHSLQNVYALPNKLFEYIMAGLAVCVSDLPEMARVVNAHGTGIVFGAVSPDAIAGAVNQLDRPSIDRYKLRSLEAAEELNWDVEGRRLIDACRDATSRGFTTD